MINFIKDLLYWLLIAFMIVVIASCAVAISGVIITVSGRVSELAL